MFYKLHYIKFKLIIFNIAIFYKIYIYYFQNLRHLIKLIETNFMFLQKKLDIVLLVHIFFDT